MYANEREYTPPMCTSNPNGCTLREIQSLISSAPGECDRDVICGRTAATEAPTVITRISVTDNGEVELSSGVFFTMVAMCFVAVTLAVFLCFNWRKMTTKQNYYRHYSGYSFGDQ